MRYMIHEIYDTWDIWYMRYMIGLDVDLCWLVKDEVSK